MTGLRNYRRPRESGGQGSGHELSALDPRLRGNDGSDWPFEEPDESRRFHAANQPLTIEEVALNKPGRARCCCAPPLPGCATAICILSRASIRIRRRACSATNSPAIVEAVGDGVTYVKPGDHVITCLSVFCGTCPQCVTGHPNLCENTDVKMLPGVARRMTLEGRRADEPVLQPVVFRRTDAGAREFDGEDRPRHPARPRGAGRLRRDDRGRRGVQRRQGRAGLDGRGDRLRRGRAVGGQRRRARRGRAHHRDRHRRLEARAGARTRRHRHAQRRATPTRSKRSGT